MSSFRLICTILFLLLLKSELEAQSYAIGYRDLDLFNTVTQRITPIRLYYPAAVPGDGAPFAPGSTAPFPIVAFAGHPGIGIGAYRYFADHLVTRGYIVAILHSDTADAMRVGQKLAGVPRSLLSATTDSDSPLQGAPIGERSVLGGHGAGGTAALFALDVSDRGELPHFTIGANVVLDPRVLDIAARAQGSALTISGANDCYAPDSANGLRLHAALRSDCRARAVVRGASHCYFAGQDIACSASEAECTVSPTIAREEQHRVVDSLLLTWLDWQLRDRCEGLQRFAAFVDSSGAIDAVDACADPLVGFSLAPGDRIDFCPGDTVVLSAPEGYESYMWDDGVTTRTRSFAEPGAARVTARGGPSCSIRSAYVGLHYALEPLVLEGIHRLCPGGTLQLESTSKATRHRWSTGDTTRSITVSSGGRYWVTYSNALCTLTSDTVLVVEEPAPRIVVDGSLVACADVPVTLSAPAHMRGVRWSDGASAQSVVVNRSGAHWFTARDTNGCIVTSDTVEIVRRAPLVPTITLSGATLTSTAAVSYQWTMDGDDIPGANERTHVVTRNAYYSVRTVDSNGCVARAPGLSVILSGIADEAPQAPSIAVRDGVLRVTSPTTDPGRLRIVLVDARGAFVRALTGAGPHDLRGIPSGLYHVLLEHGHRNTSTQAIVIVR